MPTIDIYNTKGEKTSKMILPKEIFSAEINKPLMTQAVRIYLSNQRQSPAKTKTRSEISLSSKKIHRQKGTGNARHGSRRAPIFVKGSKAHGPTGKQNYKLKISKKMRKKALFSALTSKLEDKEIIIIDGLEKISPKTKKMMKIITNLKYQKVKSKNTDKRLKMTLILPKVLDNVIRAGRNIAGLNLRQAQLLNTYEVLNGGGLVFMKDSISVLKKRLLK